MGFKSASERLDDIKRRLATFEARHTPNQSALIRELNAQEANIRRKVDSAVARGDTWQGIGAEFERDFTALEKSLAQVILSSGESQ